MIDHITIKGYKSIRSLESFELKRMNVLIGANGAGKSNFVGFFRFLRSLVEQRLQLAVGLEDGADAVLFMGPRVTSDLSAQLTFHNNRFGFSLLPTAGNRLLFKSEDAWFKTIAGWKRYPLGSGHQESQLKERVTGSYSVHHYVYDAMSNWIVYHFHDTSSLASVRRPQAINDNMYFREDAANLAPFLYLIKTTHREHYQRIRNTVRLAAPFFDDFELRPIPATPDLIQLEWRQKDSDHPFRAHQMSDGHSVSCVSLRPCFSPRCRRLFFLMSLSWGSTHTR